MEDSPVESSREADTAGQALETENGLSFNGLSFLGLAPDWASGRRATTAEQQVVSACLAAHTTNSGVRMAISVLGTNGRGQPIPYTREELAGFPRCTLNGIHYRPITTRLRSRDVFLCGDGVCQFTESCGVGLGYRDCLLDCGLCL